MDILEYLDENYIPENLPFRENQIRIIKEKIEKYSRGFNPSYLLIFGSSGLGKTASVKFVFKNLFIQNVRFVYINAFLYNTLNSLLVKIAEELKLGINFKGYSNEEIINLIFGNLKNTNTKLVICIDEVDKIKDLNETLYIFARLESLLNFRPYLILISNTKDFILNLDQRVLSSLVFDELEFKPYTIEQLKVIAEERIKPIFGNNYDKSVLTLIANECYNNGSDVRIILKILRKAIEVLEERGENRLSIDIIKEVVKDFQKKVPKIEIKNLEIKDERQKEILEILKQKGREYTSELFKIINQKYGIKKRMFNYLMKDLINKGLIEIKREKGVRGSKFIAYLKV
ncbi:MAG: orc1/cdc6 family replication initiation protein [Candidatus Aenigmatarchaeota archaeon]